MSFVAANDGSASQVAAPSTAQVIASTQPSLKSDFSGGSAADALKGHGPQGGLTPKLGNTGGPAPVADDGQRSVQGVFKPNA